MLYVHLFIDVHFELPSYDDVNVSQRRMMEAMMMNKRMKKKESLVSDELGQIVEMCYWFVKFVGDFEKDFETPVDEKLRFFGENSAAVVKFARYVIKFLRSFEKLSKV